MLHFAMLSAFTISLCTIIASFKTNKRFSASAKLHLFSSWHAPDPTTPCESGMDIACYKVKQPLQLILATLKASFKELIFNIKKEVDYA